jgi:hypothetical protein
MKICGRESAENESKSNAENTCIEQWRKAERKLLWQ